MFNSHGDRIKETEAIMNKLRECITANPIGTEGWALVHEFDRDAAIRILLQASESETIHSRACMLGDQIHEGQGVKLTDEFDSYRLQSADAAPSSSSKGSSLQGDGMVTLSCNKTSVFPKPNVQLSLFGLFCFFVVWCLRKLRK